MGDFSAAAVSNVSSTTHLRAAAGLLALANRLDASTRKEAA
jgi:hypothetical protein